MIMNSKAASMPTNPYDFFAAREEKFYLTGSRFFGTTRENSDWDFFIEADGQGNINKFLESLGFCRITNSEYKDASVSSVYLGYLCGAQVHVQLVYPNQMKEKIQSQETLFRLYNMGVLFPFYNKGMMRTIWEHFMMEARKTNSVDARPIK